MKRDKIEEILTFWFGKLDSDDSFPAEKSKMWFQEGEKADAFIEAHFAGDLRLAREGKLESWKSTPRGTLALIIVLDQFPRNIFRDKPESFAEDERAARITLEGIDRGIDLKLKPVERTFFYMPLMHAESRDLQQKSIEMFTKLAEESPPALEFPLRNSLDFAMRHAAIVNRFGRFPYRNEILGRTSTPEERDYLAQPPESWVSKKQKN